MPLHFDTVEQILTQLEAQPGWEQFREYRQLLKCWHWVVNPQIVENTRPLYLNRQILYVATSSATRAQELSFQRYTLLKRLNQHLIFQIKDIRFSSSQWHQKIEQQNHQVKMFTISDRHLQNKYAELTKLPLDSSLAQKEVNHLEQADTQQNYSSPQQLAQNAVQRLLEKIEQSSMVNPTCPQCHSVATQVELNRWNLCHHCVAQKWSAEYCSAVFPGKE